MTAPTTHTPGPWSIEGSIHDTHRNERGFIISHGTNSHGDGPEGYVGNLMKVRQEDARLIAGAPSMFDALDLLDNYSLVIESAVREASPNHHTDIVKALKQASAALRIAKSGSAS
jgi:hypothetical protein